MKNRGADKRARLMLPALVLAGACIIAAGCSKAVEQKNSSSNAFRPDIRAAGAARESSGAQAEATRNAEQYSSAEYEKLGDLGFGRGNLEAAFINYEKALKLSPGDQALRCKRAWVLVAGNFNSDAAADFEAILAKRRNNASAREGLGQAYFQMKRYGQAQEQFQMALAIDPRRWRAHNYLGIMYDQRKEPRLAIEQFRAALALQPDSGFLYNNLGMAYSLAGVYDEAEASFRKALELGGPRKKILNNLGLALARMGKTEQARSAFRVAGGDEQADRNMTRLVSSSESGPR